jgi:hypothetical protein
MISMDTRELRKLERDLGRFVLQAVPHATRNAINSVAFLTRKQWVSEIQKSFTLRNTWTVRQLRVEKANGTDISTMQAVVGSLADYQGRREEDSTLHKRGRVGIAIPTPAAAGQAASATKRTRLITTRNKLGAIQLKRVRGGRDKKNAVAIAMARRAGGGVVYLDWRGGKRGLYRVTGKHGKLRKLYDLSHDVVKIKKRPTLARVLTVVGPLVPGIAQAALVGQLKRWRMLGY